MDIPAVVQRRRRRTFSLVTRKRIGDALEPSRVAEPCQRGGDEVKDLASRASDPPRKAVGEPIRANESRMGNASR